MSKNNGIKPHYTCSYEKLISTSIEKEAFLRRDVADLASRGVTLVKLDAMAAERNALIAIPSNKTEIEDSTKAVAARNKKVGEMVLAIRPVLNVARNTFGVKSATYNAFNIKDLSTLSASALYEKSGNIVTRANANLVAMEAKGLTATMLTDITTIATALFPLITAPPVLKADDNLMTAERQTAANNVYDTAIAFCELGKSRYMDVNITKYNNYVFGDKTVTVVDRKGKVATYGHKGPKTDGITLATRFRLRTTLGKSLLMYFSLLKGDAPPAGALEVLANPNLFIEKTAAQLGFNPATGVIQLNIYNPNAEGGAFFVKIG